MEFDGIDDLVNAGNDSSLNITEAITLEAKVKVFSCIDAYPKAIVKPAVSGWSSPYFYYSLGTGDAASIKASFGVIANTNEIQSGVLNASQWYHIVGTYDGSYQRLYVDGIEVNSAVLTGSIPTSSQPLAIGARSTTSINERFNGLIARVVIYNKALSAQQVKECYQQCYRLI